MKNIIKEKKGITLIALVITIIVLLILAGVSLGELIGKKTSITESKDKTALSELTKIQQAVIEIYLKYTQLGNKMILKGTSMTYADALSEFNQLGSSESLKVQSYDGISETDPGLFYYKVGPSNLKEMGLENIHREDEYVVNYSTGEVFNITQKKISSGHILYVASKRVNSEYIKDGLVLHYDGINNTGNGHSNSAIVWKDLSSNGNDGTLNNISTVLTNESGWGENYLALDGVDDYVSAYANTSGDYTIEFIAKDIQAINSAKYGSSFMINTWTSDISSPSLQLFLDGRNSATTRKRYRVRWTRVEDDTNTEIQFYEISDDGGFTISNGNNTIKTYFNGEKNDENVNQSYYERSKIENMRIEIGRWYRSSTYSIKEKIYSFRIYNRALTDEEVLHNYEIDKVRFGI